MPNLEDAKSQTIGPFTESNDFQEDMDRYEEMYDKIVKDMDPVKITDRNGMVMVGTEPVPFMEPSKIKPEDIGRMFCPVPWVGKRNRRWYFRKCGDYLKASCVTMARLLKGAIYRVYIEGKEKYIDRWAFRRSKAREKETVNLINKNISVIREHDQPETENVLGFVMLFGMNTKQLKKTFGKNPWKRLCSNSKSRNDLMVKKLTLVFSVFHSHRIQAGENIYDILAKAITWINTMPSTIIKALEPMSLSAFAEICELGHCHDFWNKIRKDLGEDTPLIRLNKYDIDAGISLVADTVRLSERANNLGIPHKIDPRWSLLRFLKEHDELTRAIDTFHLPDDEIEWLETLPQTIDKDGFVAELLTTQKDIGVHSKDQHHCGAGFAPLVADARYVMYKITDPEGIVSTVGIGEGALPDQHLGAYNRRPGEDTIAFGERVKSEVLRVWNRKPEPPELMFPYIDLQY